MHAIPEGVARYDMAVIMNGLIQASYFTLDQLNNRIQLFAYGVTESKNIPPSINQRNLNNGFINYVSIRNVVFYKILWSYCWRASSYRTEV